LANFQRIIELFTQKIVTKLSKVWVWDPGSVIRDPRTGIRKKPIPDPGSGSVTLPRILSGGIKKTMIEKLLHFTCRILKHFN